jgi:PAS domain S-box-containing protein
MEATPPGQNATLLAELKSYIGFDERDAEVLHKLYPFARPHFAGVADEFYAVLRMHEGALAVLKDEAQARRLHASLQVWMGELLAGPHDEAYFERHSRIGQVHVRVGLSQHYMVTAMSRVRTSLQTLAARLFADDADADDRARIAIPRVCDLDLAIMLESYRESYIARLARSQRIDRDALESDLLERKHFFREALEAADVLVLGLDAKGKVLFFNGKAERLTGYGADEMLDADPFSRLFPDRENDMRTRVLGPAAGGAPVELEAHLTTRSGKDRLILWHIAPYRGSADAGPAVVAIGYDITDQRELERVARRSERLAAAGVLAAGLAHAIRNPLNGASLHLSILERALTRARDVPPEAGEAVDVLRTETQRLSALVTDFLEVAQPKPLVRADCDLTDLANGVATLLRPEAELRGITLRVEPSPFALKAHVDVECLRQVLVNLVRNAMEAIAERDATSAVSPEPGRGSDGTSAALPQRGRESEVVLRARRVGHAFELAVEDNGPGLSDLNAPIFDAFYTTKERGTGLGLSIVHRLVEDHGGRMAFSSRPGSTTFTVHLPMGQAR